MGKRIKYTENDYITSCQNKGMIYIGFHKEPKRGTIIDFICPIHYDKGIQHVDWGHFKNLSFGCKYCAGRGKTTEDIKKEVIDPNVEIISEYLGCEKPITCKCKQCGHIWETKTKCLTSNGTGCPICNKIKANKSETKTLEKFISEMYIIDPTIKIIGNYKNTHTLIECECLICGNKWNGYPANLLNKSASCPACNISNGERQLLNTLDELGIKYQHQYTNKNCKRINVLKFDAFDTDNNIAFEYNGEQHYRPVDYAGNGKIWAQQQFKLCKERDSIKIQYCNDNNIRLIIIPYWEKDNMKDYILKELNN